MLTRESERVHTRTHIQHANTTTAYRTRVHDEHWRVSRGGIGRPLPDVTSRRERDNVRRTTGQSRRGKSRTALRAAHWRADRSAARQVDRVLGVAPMSFTRMISLINLFVQCKLRTIACRPYPSFHQFVCFQMNLHGDLSIITFINNCCNNLLRYISFVYIDEKRFSDSSLNYETKSSVICGNLRAIVIFNSCEHVNAEHNKTTVILKWYFILL